jgi:hypothetical protein
MEVFQRFKRGADQQLWYLDQLVKVFEPRIGQERIFREFQSMVRALSEETGLPGPG